MSLKEEYHSDAKPGEALDFVNTDMNFVQNGEIGTLICRRYIKADGSTYEVKQFVSRGPVPPPAPPAPPAPAAPEAKKAEKKPEPKAEKASIKEKAKSFFRRK